MVFHPYFCCASRQASSVASISPFVAERFSDWLQKGKQQQNFMVKDFSATSTCRCTVPNCENSLFCSEHLMSPFMKSSWLPTFVNTNKRASCQSVMQVCDPSIYNSQGLMESDSGRSRTRSDRRGYRIPSEADFLLVWSTIPGAFVASPF